jgi:hypothetical protein
MVVNNTIEIELIGIKMAATTGDNSPETAYQSPITFYKCF